MRKRNCCFGVLALFFLLLLGGCGFGDGSLDKPAQEASSNEDATKQLTPTPIVDSFGEVTVEALLESLNSSVKEYGTAGFYMNFELEEQGAEGPDEDEPGEPNGMVMQMDGSIAINPAAAYMICRVSSGAEGETVIEQVIENYTLVQDDGSVISYLYDAVSDSWLAYEETGFADLSEQVSLVDFSAVLSSQIFDSVELVVTETAYEIHGTMALATFFGVTDMGMDMNTISEAIQGFEDIKVYVEYMFNKENRQIEAFQATIDKTEFPVVDVPISFEMSMAVDFEISPEGAYIEVPEEVFN